ncbi:MAG: hypothetical protein AB7D00_07985 [Rhodospirillaceae bacterium]
MPTLYYCDPGLMTDLGHHAATCREVTAVFRAKGWDVQVYLHRQTQKPLLAELEGWPYFRAHTYTSYSDDPFAAELFSFDAAAKATREDLEMLPEMASGDLVFWNTASAPHIAALGAWQAERFSAASSPAIFVELGKHPGWSPGAPVTSQEPGLFRYAARRIDADAGRRFHCLAFDPRMAEAYALLLERPVHALTPPRSAAEPRRRRMSDPPTVGVLGHQRPKKGFDLMPEICRLLFACGADVHILAHNGAPESALEATQALEAIAADDPRLTVIHKTADAQMWDRLYDAIDLLLLPYDPAVYRANYSAVQVEALCRGIPCVVPADTALAATLEESGGTGTVFAEWTPGCIADALLRALAGFDDFAERAYAAALEWNARSGARKTVQELLDLREKEVQAP